MRFAFCSFVIILCRQLLAIDLANKHQHVDSEQCLLAYLELQLKRKKLEACSLFVPSRDYHCRARLCCKIIDLDSCSSSFHFTGFVPSLCLWSACHWLHYRPRAIELSPLAAHVRAQLIVAKLLWTTSTAPRSSALPARITALLMVIMLNLNAHHRTLDRGATDFLMLLFVFSPMKPRGKKMIDLRANWRRPRPRLQRHPGQVSRPGESGVGWVGVAEAP